MNRVLDIPTKKKRPLRGVCGLLGNRKKSFLIKILQPYCLYHCMGNISIFVGYSAIVFGGNSCFFTLRINGFYSFHAVQSSEAMPNQCAKQILVRAVVLAGLAACSQP